MLPPTRLVGGGIVMLASLAGLAAINMLAHHINKNEEKLRNKILFHPSSSKE